MQGGFGHDRHEPHRLHRGAGRQGPRPRALPGGLRRAPQGQGRPARRERPDPRRVGSLHVLDPHGGSGPDQVQGHHRRRHGPGRPRRSHGSVALDRRRLAGREEAADGRDQGRQRQHHPPLHHAGQRSPDDRRRRHGQRRRRAGEDSARDHQDQGHHGRPAARGRAVRSAQAEGSGGHQRDRWHGEVRRRRQGPAQDPDRAGRPERPSRANTASRAACTSTSRKATASAPATR